MMGQALRLRLISAALVGAGISWLLFRTTELSAEGSGRLMFGCWKTRDLLGACFLLWLSVPFLLASFSKKACLRFSLVHFALGTGWIGLEAAGHLDLVDYQAHFRPVAKGSLGTVPVPDMKVEGTTYEDLASAWSVTSEPIPFSFQTDRRGFRNEPDRGEADVYCLGDSFLVAGLVPWKDTVTAQLETRLATSTIAFALNGISPQREIELFREAELPVDGKLVVHFLFEGNDLLDSASFRSRDEVATRSTRDRSLTNNVILKLQELTQPMEDFVALRSGSFGDQRYLFRWNREAFEGFESETEAILSELDAFRDEVEAGGGTYVVAMIPSKIRVLGPYCEFPAGSPLADWKSHCSDLPADVRSWCSQENVPYIDLSAALDESMRSGEAPWFAGDTHWNSLGNRIAASAVASSEAVQAWLTSREGDRP